MTKLRTAEKTSWLLSLGCGQPGSEGTEPDVPTDMESSPALLASPSLTAPSSSDIDSLPGSPPVRLPVRLMGQEQQVHCVGSQVAEATA